MLPGRAITILFKECGKIRSQTQNFTLCLADTLVTEPSPDPLYFGVPPRSTCPGTMWGQGVTQGLAHANHGL